MNPSVSSGHTRSLPTPGATKSTSTEDPTLQAYCAADALGIPAMLGRSGVVTSHDPHSGAEVQVVVRDGRATPQPVSAVVSLPDDSGFGDDQAAGDSACPTVNFYASVADAHAYEQAHGLSLDILTVPQAHQLGSAIFGDLLEGNRAANGAPNRR